MQPHRCTLLCVPYFNATNCITATIYDQTNHGILLKKVISFGFAEKTVQLLYPESGKEARGQVRPGQVKGRLLARCNFPPSLLQLAKSVARLDPLN